MIFEWEGKRNMTIAIDYEGRELFEKLTPEQLPVVLPFSLREIDGEMTVSVWEEALEIAHFVEALPEEKCFSADTMETVREMVVPVMKEFGFEDADIENNLLITKVMEKEEALNESAILPGTRFVKNDDGLENLTSSPLNMYFENLLAAGVVKDGKILSAAAENARVYLEDGQLNYDFDEDDAVRDICVETAPGEEGKGYAASAVAYLTRELLRMGKVVTYTLREDNPASERVAEKVGFRDKSKEFVVACFRDE